MVLQEGYLVFGAFENPNNKRNEMYAIMHCGGNKGQYYIDKVSFSLRTTQNFFKGTWQRGGFSGVSGFEFAEIFVIEKQHPDSPSRGVDKIPYRYNFFKPLNQSMLVVHCKLIFC
jgi:hypothetical protein